MKLETENVFDLDFGKSPNNRFFTTLLFSELKQLFYDNNLLFTELF